MCTLFVSLIHVLKIWFHCFLHVVFNRDTPDLQKLGSGTVQIVPETHTRVVV